MATLDRIADRADHSTVVRMVRGSTRCSSDDANSSLE
jgi:hypothetical protein